MLVMDIGNSRIKWRETDKPSSRVHSESYCSEQLSEQLVEWFEHIALKSPVIICSVANAEVNGEVRRYFDERNIKCVFLQVSREKAGVRNGYKIAEQMGVDRWVAVVTAYNKYQSAVCVMDAGTALTIDVVDEQGCHLGGLIMPGLNLMKQSLLSGTAGIDEASNSSYLLADNTADAVSSGCSQLIISSIGPIIERIQKQYGLDLITVVTGGDAELVAEHSSGVLKLEKWLILDGLEQLFADEV